MMLRQDPGIQNVLSSHPNPKPLGESIRAAGEHRETQGPSLRAHLIPASDVAWKNSPAPCWCGISSCEKMTFELK